MNIVYLCANPGLDLEKMLGPKIHIQAILRGLKIQNVNATLVAVQKSDSVRNYDEFETVILPHRYLRGFVHRIVPYTGIVDSLRIFFKIIDLNRTKHFALIHERYTGLSWGSVLTAKFLKIPFILEMNGPGIEEKTIQGNPIKQSKKWLLLLNQKWFLSNSNRLILASKLIASFIHTKRGWKLPKYHVLLNGADLPELITPDEKAKIRSQYYAEDRPLFLYSGSLYSWYGSLNIVKSFQIVLQSYPNLKLVVIGSGDAESEMRNYIQTNRLGDSIFMAGAMAHSALQKVIHAVDFCLVYYPGEPTYFGTSTKITEYMSAGKSVISTPHMLEIIDDGITGFLSKSPAPEEFADKLIEVVQNLELARTVGENARAKIESQFLWKHYTLQLTDIYQSLVER